MKKRIAGLKVSSADFLAIASLEHEHDASKAVQLLRGSSAISRGLRDTIADFLEGKLKKKRGRPAKSPPGAFDQMQTNVRTELFKILVAEGNTPKCLKDILRAGVDPELFKELIRDQVAISGAETAKSIVADNVGLTEAQIDKRAYPRRKQKNKDTKK